MDSEYNNSKEDIKADSESQSQAQENPKDSNWATGRWTNEEIEKYNQGILSLNR